MRFERTTAFRPTYRHIAPHFEWDLPRFLYAYVYAYVEFLVKLRKRVGARRYAFLLGTSRLHQVKVRKHLSALFRHGGTRRNLPNARIRILKLVPECIRSSI